MANRREAKLACACQTAPGGGVAKADYYATLNNSHAFGRKKCARSRLEAEQTAPFNRVCVVADAALNGFGRKHGSTFRPVRRFWTSSTQPSTCGNWLTATSDRKRRKLAEWMELQKGRLLSNKVAAVIEDISTIAPRRMDARALIKLANSLTIW